MSLKPLYYIIGRLAEKRPESTEISVDYYEGLELEAGGLTLYY